MSMPVIGSRWLILAGLFSLLIPAAVKADDPAPGKQVAQTLEVTSGDAKKPIKYWLYLPEKVGTEKDAKFPLMLFLHGAGERGDDLEKVKVHGPPKIAAMKADFPFVLISPQCASNLRWQPEELIQIVDHVIKTQRIDEDRVYVTGLSMGGFGTWALAAAHPNKFAAAVPICGGGSRMEPQRTADAEKLKSLPIWVFHGAKDTTVRPEQSEQMVEAIKKAGGEPKYTVYPDAGHDSWTETYNNQEVYDWLLKQKRKGA